MMKDKIYFFITNLYGWLIIILIGTILMPLYTSGNLLPSFTDIICILYLFIFLYIRIKLQIKRDVTWRDYLLLFVIDAVFILVSMYICANLIVFFFPVFVFLDFLIYIMKHIHIKSIMLNIMLDIIFIFLLCIFLYYITFLCIETVPKFINVFCGILRNI